MFAKMKALTMNEAEMITGAMTREEREEAIRAKDDDGIFDILAKGVMRPVVHGLDTLDKLLEPVNKQLEKTEEFRMRTQLTVKYLWNKFTDWF